MMTMMTLKEFEIFLKELKLTYGRAIEYRIDNVENVVDIRVYQKRGKGIVFFQAPLVSSRMNGIRDSIPYVTRRHKVIQLTGFQKYIEALLLS